MADKDPFQFPWASMAVVATLVSSTVLAPHAFDLLRPPEKDRAQTLVSADLEVEARLWEDPFVATRRHELERQQRCDKEAQRQPRSRDCNELALTERRSPPRLRERLDFDHDGDIEDTLLLAVMVPGNAFVGAEEARRRTRYGVLAGLQAEGYLPDAAEHIGLLQLDIPPLRPTAVAEAADRLLMPYEVLSPRRDRVGSGARDAGAAEANGAAPAAAAASRPPAANGRKRYRSIALLWVDESALPAPKLDGLAYVLDTVAGRCARCPPVALIGPSTSDGLRNALSWLDRRAAQARKHADKQAGKASEPVARTVAAEAVDAGYRLLSNAALFNSSATISDSDLGELHSQPMGDFLRRRMARVLGVEAEGPAAPKLTFERTIASDDVVLKALAEELQLRLPLDGSRRVVLVTESDSIYSRTLERRFSRLIKPLRNGQSNNEDHVYFFRGVDGVTLRDGVERSAPTKADPNAAIEWPESRDQLDYLRRMAQSLKRSESLQGAPGSEAVGGIGPIGAIGIFANDVHDKLLVLQALHESFPDKVFFTTDMDARYLHPRTLQFTRNLVVASSLPLRFAPQPAGPAASAGVGGGRVRSLQTGTPPFRDVYQAATYAAARLASCKLTCSDVQRAAQGLAPEAACKQPCGDIQDQVRAIVARPTVYEVGRDRAVALAGFGASPRVPHEPSSTYQVGLAVFLAILAMGLLLWPSTPALRRARDAVIGAGSLAGERQGGYSRLAAAFALVYAGLFACAAGSVVEALRPGSLGLAGVLSWGGLAVLASLVLYPGSRVFGYSGSWRRGPRWRPVAGAALLLTAIWAAWLLFNPAVQAADGEPLAWLQGISGWPSHLLNLLALVCGVATLDRLWAGIADARRADEDWLGLTGLARTDVGFGAPVPGAARDAGPVRRAWHWLSQRTLLGWRRPEGKAVHFAELWRGYQLRGAALPRSIRVAFWTVTAACAVGLLFWAFSDHELPEVPVRGVEHRGLIRLGYMATLLLLPLVVVAVADATMLAWRFLRMLGTERTLYAPATVARFATALGSVHLDQWTRRVAADPAERDHREVPADQPGHTLLDDWIDIQVIARRTRAVAPLVVAPFLMLALMVVARSRLFDNWSLSWPIATAAALYVVWLGLLALLLKQAAEDCRTRALARMNADLRWMAGADEPRKALVEPMKRLIAAVEAERSGAFAPPFDQPFFKGLLVPLGGAGGAQLFERLLLAN